MGVPYLWKYEFLVYGVLMDAAEFGNLHYGYVGTKAGVNSDMLKYAGGIAESKWNAIVGPFKANYGDKAEDAPWVQAGINWAHGGDWATVVNWGKH